mmetsp:Transcript_11426/g.34341  ORF Transcript_11426/g.34341 Transcript_11426/m.34341 type:complete len:224 (-) Transcript_11426:863-1534(-)
MRDWSWLHSTGSYESFSIPLDTLGLSCQSTQFPRGTQQERHAAALQGGVVALYARQPEDGVILHQVAIAGHGEPCLLLGRVGLPQSHVLGRPVGGDEVLLVRLPFLVQILLRGQSRRLVARVQHVPPELWVRGGAVLVHSAAIPQDEASRSVPVQRQCLEAIPVPNFLRFEDIEVAHGSLLGGIHAGFIGPVVRVLPVAVVPHHHCACIQAAGSEVQQALDAL